MTHERTLAEMLRHNAEVVVRAARDLHDTELRFDRDGVVWVDEYIAENRDLLTEQDIDQLVNNLGAFVGECILASFGGRWVRDDMGVAIYLDESGKNAVFPLNKVRKRIRNGPEDSVTSLYDAIAAVFRR